MYTTARYLAGLQSDPNFPVHINLSLAVQLFQRCIDEQNHVGAMYDLAKILENRHHHRIQSNLPRAVELYSRCAANGCKSAISSMYTLAKKLQTPLNFRTLARNFRAKARNFHYTNSKLQNFPLVAELLSRCAAHGHEEAGLALRDLANSLGPFLLFPCALPTVGISRASNLYQGCSDVGVRLEPLKDLAKVFFHEKPGILVDYPQQVHLYHNHARQRSDKDALIHLARLYESGRVESDVARIAQLYKGCTDSGYLTTEVLRLARELTFIKWNTCDENLVLRLVNLFVDQKDLPAIERAYALMHNLEDASYSAFQHDMIMFVCFLESRQGVQYVRKIADVVALAATNATDSQKKQENTQLAVSIYKLCIDLNNDPQSKNSLVEILISEGIHLEDWNLTKQLFQNRIESRYISGFLDLAGKLARGTSQITRDIPFALLICELCVEKIPDDEYALLMLARVILSGSPGDEDISRAFGCCFQILESRTRNDECSGLLALADDLASGASGIARNVPLAIQLGEMCVDMSKHERVAVSLSKTLLLNRPGTESIQHVVNLCKTAAKENSNCSAMIQLAKSLWNGTLGTGRSASLAVQLCEILVEHDHREVSVILAEFLLTGPASVRDMSRGMRLVKDFFGHPGIGRYDYKKVADIAVKIAKGTEDTVRNKALAIEICELCIENENGPSARMKLAEILVCGVVDESEAERTVELCKTSLEEFSFEHFVVIHLAKKLCHGSGGIVRDVKLAVRLLELCVEIQNSREAMKFLGEILSSDIPGVAKDLQRASELLHRAAGRGF